MPGVKVGHAGTLDPFAEGVLLVCLGRATKRASQLMALEKQYNATLEFGIETDTLDVSGAIVQRDSEFQLQTESLNAVVSQFVGVIEQTPPSFSAVHVNGQRAYQLAREGKDVKLQSRQVTISELNVIRVNTHSAELSIRCSKGTYIRSLARDIARELGTVAYLKKLSRVRIGDYDISNAISIMTLNTLNLF